MKYKFTFAVALYFLLSIVFGYIDYEGNHIGAVALPGIFIMTFMSMFFPDSLGGSIFHGPPLLGQMLAILIIVGVAYFVEYKIRNRNTPAV